MTWSTDIFWVKGQLTSHNCESGLDLDAYVSMHQLPVYDTQWAVKDIYSSELMSD